MKSKFVALFLIAAMLCFALIGCAPKETTEPEPAATEPALMKAINHE